LQGIYRRLAASDLETRKAEPYLEPGREDVIVPGLAVLCGLVALAGLSSLTITHLGLREGILDELLRGGGDGGKIV
jgi:exopolyphosphatase/pppGpp-phosphohydrolase